MNRKTIYSILGLIAFAIIPVYWLKLAYTNVLIRDGLYISTVFISVLAGMYAISRFGFKNARGLALICFTLGLVSLLLGNLAFEYYYIIDKNNIPFPSLSDFFSLSYYVFFLAALIIEVKLAHVNWKKINIRILILPIILSIISTIVVYYIGIYKAYDPTVDLFSNIVNIAYGVGDLILIIISLFLLVLVKEYQGGKMSRILLILLISLLFEIVGDIFLAFYMTQYNNEVWFYKSFFDTTSMIGYLLSAAMLFEYGFSFVDAFKMAGVDLSKNATPLTLNSKNSKQASPGTDPATSSSESK